MTEERLKLREVEVRRREEQALQFEERLRHREQQLRQWEERLRQSEAEPRQTQPAPAERPTPPPGGLLRVQRKTGVNGLLMKIQVLVDREMQTQLAVNATADSPLEAGGHVVEVKGGGAFGGARHEIVITPGRPTFFQSDSDYSESFRSPLPVCSGESAASRLRPRAG